MDLKHVDRAAKGREQDRVHRDPLDLLAARIRSMREGKGFTQEHFAEIAQLDRAYYGRIERGGQNVAFRTLCVIARGLEVTVAELVGDISVADLKAMKPQRPPVA